MEDRERYKNGKMPFFQMARRKVLASSFSNEAVLGGYVAFLRIHIFKVPVGLLVGRGLIFRHSYYFTTNPDAKMGSYVSIHKELTIGIENREKW